MTTIATQLRNPAVWPYIDQSTVWVGSSVAPHAPTVRISWTTPQGPPTLLQTLYHRRAVATAPSTYGESGIQLQIGGSLFQTISTILSAATPLLYILERQVMYLPANTLIEVLTFDLSTGGTINWRLSVQSLRVFP